MPGVKGTFEIDNRASGPLRDMRTEARSTKAAFRELGTEMDKLGANTTNLDRYKRSLKDMGDQGVRSLGSLSDSWDRTAASSVKSIKVMEAGIDGLQVKMKEVSDTRMTPKIELKGVDESLAKIELLQVKMKELSRDRANPRVLRSDIGSSGGSSPSSASLMRDMLALRSWERANPNFFAAGGSGGGGRSGGGMVSAGFSGASSLASDASGLAAGIPALAVKAGAALPVVQSLGGATAALLSSMTGAALGAGAVSIAGGGALAVGIGSIMAVAKPALSSIQNVYKAQVAWTQAVEQSNMPSQMQTQQIHAVVEAEDTLRQAQVQSTMAQLTLTEARREARNQLKDLGLAAQGAALGEKQAALTLASSQRALYEAQTSPTSQPLQIEQAELAVQQARLGTRQSVQQYKEARESATLAQRRGVSGAPSVMSAQQGAAQSRVAIRNSQWAVEEARRNVKGGSSVEQARMAYNSALSKAPAGTKELVEAGKAFMHEWKGATAGASRDFVGILSGTVGTLHAMMPTLAGASNRSMGALRASGQDFGKWLRSPQNQGFITTGSKMFAENLGNAEESVTHIFSTLENIATAARPFLHEATVAFDHWTGSWESGTKNISQTRTSIGHMVEDAKVWSRMWMEGWKLLHDIMVAGGATQQGNTMIGSFTKSMDRWDAWVKQNPQKVHAFFRQTREGAEGLARAVASIASSINSVASELQPLLKGGLGILGALNSTGLTGSIGGLGGLYGLYRVGRSALSGGRGAGGVMAAGGGRVVSSPGSAAASGLGGLGALLMGGGGSMMGNVRTMPNVASRLPGGGFMVSSARGRPISADAHIIAAHEAAAVGSPFLSIAGSETRGGMRGLAGGMLTSARGLAGAGAGRLGSAVAGGARVAAPFVAMNAALTAASGQNPTQSSSTGGSMLSGAVQGGLMGSALGPWGAAAGAGAGALTALLLHKGPSTQDLVSEARKKVAERVGMPGEVKSGGLAGIKEQQAMIHKLTSELQGASKVEKALGSVGLDTSKMKADTVALKEQLAERKKIANTSMQEAGVQSAQAWATAFQAGSARVGPMHSMKKMREGMMAQLQQIPSEGRVAFAKSISAWAAEIEQQDPAMRKPVERMVATLTGDMHTLGQNVASVNGSIVEGTYGEWTKIAEMMTNPVKRAQEELEGSFGKIRQEALKNLEMLGFSKGEAQVLVTGTTHGGAAASHAAQAVKAHKEGKEGLSTFQTAAANVSAKGHATGGRLGGMGSYDTVKMGDGGYGAPGELVVNRHTEMAANMGLARAGMPSLAALVSGQTIPHSTPMFRAKGGEVGGMSHFDRLVSAANRVSAANFPYKWGGGHENPSHFEPFDCSGAVSYAAQQAGYNVPTTVAQSIAGWGFPAGEGQATIFYKGEPGAHTFMRIGGKYWGTSGFARPGGGAGWFDQAPSAAYLGGFNKVHLPNLGTDSMLMGAGGGGGIGGELNLKAPKIAAGGLGGLMVNGALGAYASGLSGKLNRQIGGIPGRTAKGRGAGGGGGNPLLDSVLAAAGGHAVGASFYGGPSDPSSGVTGYKGDNLPKHPDSYAELNMGHALGGLPYLTPLQVSYNGRSTVLKKRDIGAGGGAVSGHPRAIDLWYEAANALGFSGLGVVDVKRMAKGGRLGEFGGVPFVGGFKHGGSFTTRPGKPVSFVAGEGSHVEDVHIAPRKGAPRFPPGAGNPTIKVEVNIGDVTVPDVKDLKKVIDEASDEAARKLLAAFGRRVDRNVAGTVHD